MGVFFNRLRLQHLIFFTKKCFCLELLPNLKHQRLYCLPSKTKQVYLVDENDHNGKTFLKNPNKFTNRCYTCGDLRVNNIGETVTIYGWLEYQRMNKFVVLRDSYGETQVLISDQDTKIQNLLGSIPLESIIEVKGTVLARPKDMVNKKLQTGEIEILADTFNVINIAKEILPFNIRQFQKAKESLRMQYRYLDLRFPYMQRNLRVRSSFLMKIREFLTNNYFIDVETPTLFKATPGGAQEFIVPTRFPGQFYSLVQSPQQFKQMLMAGAIDRYFQIARCYRDESTRSDRQPEFTQLDIEMSFTNVEGVIQLIEETLNYCWPEFLDPIPPKFQRMTYNEAMETYGSDKPDTRFDFKLKNCTKILAANTSFLTNDFACYCISIPGEYIKWSHNVRDALSQLTVKYKKAKFVQTKVKSTEVWVDKMTKLFTHPVAQEFVEKKIIEDNSLLFLAYGSKKEVLPLLGTIRLEYVKYLEESFGMKIKKEGMHFLWVVDFPLFELSEETGLLQSAHHPFTAPHPDDLSFLSVDPLKVRALAYDLVLNGNEVGGGSIRIHNPTLQKLVLDQLKIPSDTMQHILDMLGSGCPPHGGIALGLDRLLAVLLNTQSIRDVIAFPKSHEGRDPLSGAPSNISDKEKNIYHIQSITPDSNK